MAKKLTNLQRRSKNIQTIRNISEVQDDAVYEYTIRLQRLLKREMKSRLSLKTKWLQSQIQWTKKKTSKGVTFELGIRDTVHFSPLLTEGGVRHPKVGKYIAVPNYPNLGIKKDGKITRSKKPSSLLRKKKVFLFSPEGKMPYIASVVKSKITGEQRIKVLYWLRDRTHYKTGNKAKFPFESLVERFYKLRPFNDELLKHLNRYAAAHS